MGQEGWKLEGDSLFRKFGSTKWLHAKLGGFSDCDSYKVDQDWCFVQGLFYIRTILVFAAGQTMLPNKCDQRFNHIPSGQLPLSVVNSNIKEEQSPRVTLFSYFYVFFHFSKDIWNNQD